MSIHSTSLLVCKHPDNLLKCILTSKGCNCYLIGKNTKNIYESQILRNNAVV